MSMRLDRTWAGLGVKVGGIAMIGADTFEGVAWRLDGSPSASAHAVNVTNVRLGIGLGGSIGVCLLTVFNAGLLWEVNEKQLTDWGATFSIPAEKITFGRHSLEVFKGLSSGIEMIRRATAEDIENVREIASALYSTMCETTEGAVSDEAKIALIDVPGAGWGAEVSISMSGGEFAVDKAIQL